MQRLLPNIFFVLPFTFKKIPFTVLQAAMRVSELEWVTRAQRVRYPPPPPIPYTFPGRLDPLVGAASGTTTSEAQRPHPGRIRKLRAGGVMGISVSAAPVGMASQT
jgi:hypothetical protein